MRALLVVLALVSSGCAVRLGIDFSIRGNRDPAPLAVPVPPPPDPALPDINALIEDYRVTLELACQEGTVAAETCLWHRDRLVELAQGSGLQQRVAAQRLVESADTIEHPLAKRALGAIGRTLQRLLRR